MNHSRSRKAFTLVEILVVIVILGIMAAMVTTAVSGVTSTAKQSRTKNIIAIVDSVLAEQYENLKYRQLPVECPDASSFNNDYVLSLQIPVMEAARVRLMMKRDLQRMEMPDRYSDFKNLNNNAVVNATLLKALPVKTIMKKKPDTTPEEYQIKQDDARDMASLLVAWNRSNRVDTWHERTTDTATLENQGSECLYMIMATSYVGGIPALESIPESNIGDTDGDSMLEILDGWGRPLEFIRWPTGYFDPADQTRKLRKRLLRIDAQGNPVFEEVLLTRNDATEIAEDLDLFQVDYAFLANNAKASRIANPNPDPNERDSNEDPPDPNNQRVLTYKNPWALRPLVFSRGPDGESGIHTNPIYAPGAKKRTDGPFFSYYDHWEENWTPNRCGNENFPTRGTSFSYPDPYLRPAEGKPAIIVFPGARKVIEGSNVAYSPESLDNITNYELQASQR